MWVRSKSNSEAVKIDYQNFVVLSDVICTVETKTQLHSCSVVGLISCSSVSRCSNVILLAVCLVEVLSDYV